MTDNDGFSPGPWYRIKQRDGTLWMVTRDREEVMRAWAARPTNSGWSIQQQWIRPAEYSWRHPS